MIYTICKQLTRKFSIVRVITFLSSIFISLITFLCYSLMFIVKTMIMMKTRFMIFYDDFNRENRENYNDFKDFEANDHRQFERQQFMNFELITQMLIVENILKNKRSLDFHDKERNHLTFHDWMKKHQIIFYFNNSKLINNRNDVIFHK